MVVAAQGGDTDALRELYGRLQSLVTYILLAVAGRRPGLEDLGDEICADVVLRLGSFKPRGSFAAWAGKAALWRCHRWLRTEGRRTRTHAESGTISLVAAESPEMIHNRNETLLAAELVMQKMPRRLLECFTLVDLVGETPKEAAKTIGGNPREIANSAYRARLLLRSELETMGLLERRAEAASAVVGAALSAAQPDGSKTEGAEGGGVDDERRAAG